MKPSKKKSKKKKKSTPPPATETVPAAASGASSSPPTETITLDAAVAASETESTGGGEASTSMSSASASFSTFSSSSSTESSSSAAGAERRDLAWLLDAFGSASIDQVDSAYREAGGDPFLAAGILGSSVEPQSWPTPPLPDLSPRAGSGGRKASRRAKRNAVVATGMVADVIGRDYARSAISPVSGRKEWKGRDGEMDGGAGVRYSAEEAEQFFCSMLGDNSELGMGVVRDVLGQYGYDGGKALDALLNISGSSSVENMEMCFPDAERNDMCCQENGTCKKKSTADDKIKSYQLAGKTLNMVYHHSEKEDEFLWGTLECSYLKDIQSSEMPKSTVSPTRSTMVKSNAQQQVLESLFKIPEIRTYEPSSMDWKKVVRKLQSFNSPFISNSQERPKNGNGYQEFRETATRHYDTMKTYYQKAAVAYAKGEHSYASYLAEEGKHYRELARKEDERASREIFEARNKHIKNTVTIDLHGQHVKQAIRLLKVHMLICVCMPSVLLKVITGCGVEGTGKGKIKRAVISLVERECVEWCEENSGTIVLRLGGPREYAFTEHDFGSD